MSAKKLAAIAAKQKNGNFFTTYAHWILLSPFLLLFLTLIILPILCAIGLSFTDFNGMETPDITFLDNYIRVFSKDAVFMQKILPNTIIYAVLVGPGGFILAFFMAWMMEGEIFETISNGNIVYELVRPISIYNMWFARSVANRLSKALLRCFPILLVAGFLPAPFKMCPPADIPSTLLFVLTMILGLLVTVALCKLV